MPFVRAKRTTRPRARKAYSRSRTTRRTRTTRPKRTGRQLIVPKKCIKTFAWRKDFNVAILSGPQDVWDSDTEDVFDNGGRTYPVINTPSSLCFLGSHCSTPMGEPNDPTGASGSTWPSVHFVNEVIPNGLFEWGAFYNAGMVMASSISISMQNISNGPCGFRYVLLPIVNTGYSKPQLAASGYTGPQTLSRPNDLNPNAPNVKNELDRMSFVSLSSQPGAKFGFIKNSNNGPTRVSAKRTTKAMLNIRDLLDNDEDLEMQLAGFVQSTASIEAGQISNNQESGYLSSADSYMYYFRVFNQTPDQYSSDFPIQFMVKMKYKVLLYDRKPFSQAVTEQVTITPS